MMNYATARRGGVCRITAALLAAAILALCALLVFAAPQQANAAALKPAKVTSLTVKKTAASAITLKWTRSTNANGYIVYRANSQSGKFKKVKTLSGRNKTSASISGLDANTHYWFIVKAIRKSGRKTSLGQASKKLSVWTAPAKPAGLSVQSTSSDTITVAWDDMSRISGYEVLVSTSSSGANSTKSDVGKSYNATSISGLTPNTKYFVKARAYKTVSGKKTYGAYSSAVTSITNALETPRIMDAISGAGYGLITWNAVGGAATYEIQKSSDPNSGWKTVSKKNANMNTFYQITKASPNEPSYYRIRARNGDLSSAYSSVQTIQPKLAIPAIYQLTKEYIAWQSVDFADGYRVFTKKTGGDWELIGTSTSNDLMIPEQYQDEEAYFGVQAVCATDATSVDAAFTMRDMKYSGVKTLLDGDSALSPSYSFGKRAARLLGLNWTSDAVGGARTSDTISNAAKNIYRRSMTRGFEGYELVIFRMYGNDYNNNVKLGAIGNNDPTTFAGAYDLILKKLREDAPNAKVVLLTPMNKALYSNGVLTSCYSLKNARGDTLDDYRSIIMELAQKYDCYCYDMRDLEPLLTANLLDNTFDLRHPNYEGSLQLGNMFKFYLQYIVLADYDPSTDTFEDQGSQDNRDDNSQDDTSNEE